jgi:hypothetical protein
MPEFLLILSFALPGQPAELRAIGLFYDQNLCSITGQAFVAMMQAEEPALQADWTCVRQLGQPA